MGNAKSQLYTAEVVLEGGRSLYFLGTVQRDNIDLEVAEPGFIKVINLFQPDRVPRRAILMREGSPDQHLTVRCISYQGGLRCQLVPPGRYATPRRIRLMLM